MKLMHRRGLVAALLILLLVLILIVAGVVLYKNAVLHNLFFRSLSLDNVQSISVYNDFGCDMIQLSQEEMKQMLPLLCKIRLKGKPYKNIGLMGDRGYDYHIRLKNGVEFDLNLSGGNPGMYVIGEDAYIVGYRDDPEAAKDFENIWRLEAFHEIHMNKYYPESVSEGDS